MTPQPRNLQPATVYVDEAHLDEARDRSAHQGIHTATLLRMVLIGRAMPLGLSRTAQKAWRDPERS